MKTYLARFNKECMMVDDQDGKIMPIVLLEGIWSMSPFMAKLVRRGPMILCEFMDRVNVFINTEGTLSVLIALKRSKVE